MKFLAAIVLITLLVLPTGRGYAQSGSDNPSDLPAAYLFPWDFRNSERAVKKSPLKNITGLLVPHHMVVRQKVYEAYRIFADEMAAAQPETIIILSPNHYEAGVDNIQMNSTGFKTRFGTLEVDTEIEEALGLPINNQPFYKEHGISAQVNFIKHFFPQVKVVPIILKWETPQKDLDALAEKIATISKPIAVIASIDFSHYQTKKVADFHDVLARNVIARCDPELTSKLEIDSRASLYLFLNVLGKKDACVAHFFSHTNSQQFTNTPLTSTTSHFISFFGQPRRPRRLPKKISGLATVIHDLSPMTPGQEGRYFMGNDEVFFDDEGTIWNINLATNTKSSHTTDEKIKRIVEKGNRRCAGRDFGFVKNMEKIYCF